MRLGVMMCGGLLSSSGLAIATTPLMLPPFIRTQYANYLVRFRGECSPPNQLEIRTVKQEHPPLELASFSCWEPPDERGNRTGRWLGRLPHPQSASTFASPMTCAAGDTSCTATLAQVKAQFPSQLKQAEFQCATKNGTLFFAAENLLERGTVELRCGFFETRLFVLAGDRTQNPLESFTSVDLPVTRLNLKATQP